MLVSEIVSKHNDLERQIRQIEVAIGRLYGSPTWTPEVVIMRDNKAILVLLDEYNRLKEEYEELRNTEMVDFKSVDILVDSMSLGLVDELTIGRVIRQLGKEDPVGGCER